MDRDEYGHHRNARNRGGAAAERSAFPRRDGRGEQPHLDEQRRGQNGGRAARLGSVHRAAQAEYQGYGWAQAVHPEDAQPTIDAWEKAVAAKGAFEFEHRVRRADGAWRLCSIRANPLLDAAGAILEWVGVHTDITERRQAEANAAFLATVSLELTQAEDVAEIMRRVGAKMGAHFRLSLWNFMEIHQAGGIAVVTHEWHREDVPGTIGLISSRSLRPRNCSERVARGDVFVVRDTATDPRTDAARHAALQMRALVAVPLVRDGEWRFPLVFHDSAPRAWPDDEIALMREVTARIWDRLERLRVEEAVRINEALFSAIIEQAPGGLYAIDDRFRVRDVNARSRHVFAVAEPVLGRDFTEVICAIWGREVGLEITRIFAIPSKPARATCLPVSPRPASIPARSRATSGSCTASRCRMGGTAWSAIHGHDRAARAGGDAPHARAAELAQADRAKDEFLAMLAHELRNPLAPLRNAAEILQDRGGRRRGARAGAADHRPADRKHEPDARRPARCLAHHRGENLAAQKARGAGGDPHRRREHGSLQLRRAPQELAVALPAEPVLLEGRRHAARAGLRKPPRQRVQIQRGGQPHLAERGGGGGRKLVLESFGHVGVEDEGRGRGGASEVLVRVRDDGAGIDPELLPRIFDLFVQATRSLDRAHGGLGIGLTLVQRLVKLHGGTIEARSDGPGTGSGIHRPPAHPRQAPPPPAPPPPAAPETPRRILIVDDNTDSARSMAVLQRRRGHVTETAFTGPDALIAAAAFRPEVVLLDIGLPGMDGFEVARQLRAMPALSGVFLIAMSGYGSEEDRATARLAGFDEYLVKPLDLDRLRAFVRGRE